MTPATETKQYQTISALVSVAIILYLASAEEGFLYAGVTLAVIGALWPSAVRRIVKAWDTVTHRIGMFVGGSVLAMVYYAVVVPLAMLKRLFAAKDVKFNKPVRDTFFGECEGSFDREFFERQW